MSVGDFGDVIRRFVAVAVSTAGDGDFLTVHLASSRWPEFGLDRERYDHQSDPDEITNPANRPEQAETVAKLSQQLADYVRLKPRNRQQGLDGGNSLCCRILGHVDGEPLGLLRELEGSLL